MDRDPSQVSPIVGRHGWRYDGRQRPSFAVQPGPGQESAWDYPRPPRVELDTREIVVRVADVEVARTRRGQRVLETASPPTFYIPLADIATEYLERAPGSSSCEWKGTARYWTVSVPPVVLTAVGWSYADPPPDLDAIRDHLSFYPGRIECYIDRIRVLPQAGGFYGGWITPEVVGPFKGNPGSNGW